MGRVIWYPEQFRKQPAALVVDGGRASTPFDGCGESPGTTRSSATGRPQRRNAAV